MELKIVIDDRIVNTCRRIFSGRNTRIGLALVALAVPVLVHGAAVTKPHTFSDGNPISASQVNANFDTVYSHVKSLSESTNIRTIVSKGTANGFCPSGSVAIHVPWAYRGATGNQICAADGRGKATCSAVKYVYVTNGNGYGSYTNNDLSCGSAVANPWPWGANFGAPNTLDGEWGHGDTHVVCCR